jgi:sugar transferase (PEP-CTERM system associated)
MLTPAIFPTLAPSVSNTENTWDAPSSAQPSAPVSVRVHSLPRLRRALLIAELALLAAALIGTRFGVSSQVPALIIACCIFFHLQGLDQSIVGSNWTYFLGVVLRGVAFGFAASLGIFRVFSFFGPSSLIGRAFGSGIAPALVGALAAGLLPVISRPVLRQMISRKKLVERILIVGTGKLAGKLHRALVSCPTGYDTVYLKQSYPAEVLDLPDTDRTIDPARLHEVITQERISRVILTEPDSQIRSRLAAALLDLRLRGLQVHDAVDFYERMSRKIWVEASRSEWFLYANGFNASQAGYLLKRASDLICSALLFIATAPLAVLIAIAIKLDSRGPVLFRQERVGLHGKPFVIFKFRSMRQDAENVSGPSWARARDERVTRVGRILRYFRLDEIPQAINVLRGEMSLVGPRPERPYFVDWLAREIPFYNLRHYVKPGITGWAQVMYGYGSSVEDAHQKLQYDLYYAKHRSLRLDLDILLKTVMIVLIGRGR